jgi:hypothetical protein
MFTKFCLVLKDVLQTFGDLAHVVYVKSDNIRSGIRRWAHKDRMICFSASVAHFSEGVADLNVPYPTALLGAVDTFLEPEDIALGDVGTGRGFHVYFFLKVGIEIGGLDVHLMYFKVTVGGEGEDGVERREFGNWCKGLVKVDTFNLGETLCDDAGFMLLYTAVSTVFDMKDPLAAYDLVAFWSRDNVVNIQILPGSHFLFAGSEPLSSIRASHGLIVCLQLGGLSICDVGVVLVRQNAIARIIIRDRKASGAFGTRERRNGRDGGNDGSSGRRWSVVRFEDDVLVVRNWAPFVKYNIMRLKEFACRSVNEVESAALLGESEEHTGH